MRRFWVLPSAANTVGREHNLLTGIADYNDISALVIGILCIHNPTNIIAVDIFNNDVLALPFEPDSHD